MCQELAYLPDWLKLMNAYVKRQKRVGKSEVIVDRGNEREKEKKR